MYFSLTTSKISWACFLRTTLLNVFFTRNKEVWIELHLPQIRTGLEAWKLVLVNDFRTWCFLQNYYKNDDIAKGHVEIYTFIGYYFNRMLCITFNHNTRLITLLYALFYMLNYFKPVTLKMVLGDFRWN